VSGAADGISGMIGEFRTAAEAASAARRLRGSGFTHIDIYSPTPIDGLDQLIPTRRGIHVTAVMAVAGVAGTCLGYFIQYWDAVLSYPINVGGRPNNGWPGFVPVAWEICALFTVWFGLFAFLLLCRLPRLAQPVFAVPGFERATQDRFFLSVAAAEPRWDPGRIAWILERYGAARVTEIPA